MPERRQTRSPTHSTFSIQDLRLGTESAMPSQRGTVRKPNANPWASRGHKNKDGFYPQWRLSHRIGYECSEAATVIERHMSRTLAIKLKMAVVLRNFSGIWTAIVQAVDLAACFFGCPDPPQMSFFGGLDPPQINFFNGHRSTMIVTLQNRSGMFYSTSTAITAKPPHTCSGPVQCRRRPHKLSSSWTIAQIYTKLIEPSCKRACQVSLTLMLKHRQALDNRLGGTCSVGGC